MMAESPVYTIQPARYAKGMMAVRCPSTTGYKTRAARLADSLANSRHSGRERAYIMSPARAELFESMIRDGMDANCVTGEIGPAWGDCGPESFPEFARARWGDRWAIARDTPRNRERYRRCITAAEYRKAQAEFAAMRDKGVAA